MSGALLGRPLLGQFGRSGNTLASDFYFAIICIWRQASSAAIRTASLQAAFRRRYQDLSCDWLRCARLMDEPGVRKPLPTRRLKLELPLRPSPLALGRPSSARCRIGRPRRSRSWRRLELELEPEPAQAQAIRAGRCEPAGVPSICRAGRGHLRLDCFAAHSHRLSYLAGSYQPPPARRSPGDTDAEAGAEAEVDTTRRH